MSDGHDHHHHNAPPNPYLERRRDAEETAALAQRVGAIESLLIEKGLVTKEALDTLVDIYENDIGPMNGARVVARAWVDADYKARLLADATPAIAELERAVWQRLESFVPCFPLILGRKRTS